LTRFFFPRRDESFPACYLSSANRGATANPIPRIDPLSAMTTTYDSMSCDHQLYVCASSCNAVTRFHMVTSAPALALYVQSTPTRDSTCKNARQWSIHGIRSGRRILAMMVVNRSYYCTKENLVPLRSIPRSCWLSWHFPKGSDSFTQQQFNYLSLRPLLALEPISRYSCALRPHLPKTLPRNLTNRP
jgi:hypothetical protein